MRNFTLLILCAGFGKRMLDLTIDIPKPLLKINNQTLLGNTINFFNNIGCTEYFINSHYLHEKIENYINKNFKKLPIQLIYEPRILGTGGGVKNIFNYTKNNNICVVNSDIFWQPENRKCIINFLNDFNTIPYCKLLLSKENKFYGLKKTKGDFSISNGIVSNWIKGNEVIFYSGLQIVSKNIFNNKPNIFSMNDVWHELIVNKNLKGDFLDSKILHIGDKNTFENL